MFFYDNPTNIIDSQTAANIALQSVPGTIVDIDFDDDDDRPIYEIEIIANNRRYEVLIDAITGAVLGIELD